MTLINQWPLLPDCVPWSTRVPGVDYSTPFDFQAPWNVNVLLIPNPIRPFLRLSTTGIFETKSKVSVLLCQALSLIKCDLQLICSKIQMKLRSKYDYPHHWRRVSWRAPNTRPHIPFVACIGMS